MTKTTSNRLGMMTFLSSIVWAFFYDWQVAIILVLLFVSYRSDMVMYVQDQIDSLFENMKQ